VHLYKFFSAMSLHSADSKCQISYRWSKNGSECTILCAPTVIQTVNSPKKISEQLYTGWIVVVHLCSGFLSGVRWRHNSAKCRTAFFGQFLTSLRTDSSANYAAILTLFATSVTGPDVLCYALKLLAIPFAGGATIFAKLRSRFCKT